MNMEKIVPGATADRRPAILVIDFAGIGNGLMTLPLLERLVLSGRKVFVTTNPIVGDRKFLGVLGLGSYIDTVPAIWRRFYPEHWDDIRAFLRDAQVEIIVNFRNRGPLRDVGYYWFKQVHGLPQLAFWDLDMAEIAMRRTPMHLVGHDCWELLTAHGIGTSTHRWASRLGDLLGRGPQSSVPAREVGLFPSASQEVKRWPSENWIALGCHLIDRYGATLRVFSGAQAAESASARQIVQRIRVARPKSAVELVDEPELLALMNELASVELVVSNDSFPVHLAAACRVPCIGLYFATDSRIWGGISDLFQPVQSEFGLACPAQSPGVGNCHFFEGGCPAPCRDEVTVARVAAAIEKCWQTRGLAAVGPPRARLPEDSGGPRRT